MCSHTYPQTNIYISKGYNNALKCTATYMDIMKMTCFYIPSTSPWNLKSFNRHYLIVLRTVMKQYDIYTTPFSLNNPKGPYKPWQNDFAHVQHITTEDGGGVGGKKSGQDCGRYSVEQNSKIKQPFKKKSQRHY